MASRKSQLSTRGSKIRKQLAGYIKRTRKTRVGHGPGMGKFTAAIEKRRFLKWGMSKHLGK